MANNKNYQFSGTKGLYVNFDKNGYVTEAKGFGTLMWTNLNLDKDLIGRHVDEIAQMLKENGVGNTYSDFEINVNIPLLKVMLEEKEKIINKCT